MFDVKGYFENMRIFYVSRQGAKSLSKSGVRRQNTEFRSSEDFNPRPKTGAIYARRLGDGFGIIWRNFLINQRIPGPEPSNGC
jgi:hypothetical protein